MSGAIDGSLLVTHDNGAPLVLPTSPGGIDAVAFLSDGRVIAADAQRRMRIYGPDGAVLAELEPPTRTRALRVDDDHLATIPLYAGGVAPPVLVDLVHYRIIARLDGHVGRVFSTRWVTGGQLLTAGTDGTARLWDRATGQLRQIYQERSRIFIDAMLSDDGWVIAGGADGLLQFWNRDTGRLLWTLHAHTVPIIGVQVEAGDIVTRGFNGELSRWVLPSPRQVIQACNGHEYCTIVLR